MSVIGLKVVQAAAEQPKKPAKGKKEPEKEPAKEPEKEGE